jgi:hypothetical protein
LRAPSERRSCTLHTRVHARGGGELVPTCLRVVSRLWVCPDSPTLAPLARAWWAADVPK